MGLYALSTQKSFARAKAVSPAGAAADAGAPSPPADTRKQAFESLTKYIPTETITLFVAAMAAAPALQQALAFLKPQLLYWAFAILTPILFVLFKLSQGETLTLDKGTVFDLVAATVGYLVWALSVPSNPYVGTDAAAVAAGFGAIFISTILGRIELIVKR